jgi:ABC-2 type transport system permease protein
MRNVAVICARELKAYFASPLAYVFICIFLVLTGAVTFQLGGFLDAGQASLQPFFVYHPWLYLFLLPALGMRLWAEERKTGTIEFLMTLPVTVEQAVLGKFLAAWAFAGIALLLTFPIWITVNVLGNPDNGVIVASYFGSWLMAGGFLAIAACISAVTKNQVIAFILAATVSFLFLMAGADLVISAVSSWLPRSLVDTIAGFSFLTNFQDISKGVIDLRDALFFISLIAICLFINVQLVELKKGQ